MANLLGLIRLRRHTVEERQKTLSGLYREVENLQNKRREMEEQLQHEKDLAMDDNNAGAFYGLYAENMRKKIDRMDDAIHKLNIRIDTAREDVRSAFAEQKKVEIIQRTREDEEEKSIADREGDMLDEIGIDGFRRRDPDEKY